MEGNEPVVIANSEGRRTTPSIVAFLDNGKGERKVEIQPNVKPSQSKKHSNVHQTFHGKKFGDVSEEKKLFHTR